MTAGGLYHSEDCGEAVVASCVIDDGKAETVRDVEINAGGSVSGGTGPDQLIKALAAKGIPAVRVAATGEIDSALSRRHRIIVLIASDHYGNPDPGSTIGHWILCYGFDGANYLFMNPLGGRLQSISPATIIEMEREKGHLAVEINKVLAVDATSSPAPPKPAPIPAPKPAPAPTPHPAPGLIHASFSGRVQVIVANVRSGPGTGYPVVGRAIRGQALWFDGYIYGQPIFDRSVNRMDRRWYHCPSKRGWIASALVNGNAPGSHA